MTTRCALFAVFLLADPRPVLAGSSCGGASSGSSSSDSSSSSSSSSASDSGGDDTIIVADSEPSPACVDDTDVLGFRHCTKFGAWAKNMRLPRLFIEGGARVRSFGSGLADRSGSVTHGTESFSYRVVMPDADAHRDVAVTTNLRLGFGSRTGFMAASRASSAGSYRPRRRAPR